MSQHAPLIIDVADTHLTQADRQRLKNPLVGGIALFGRNWKNRAQLTQLCTEVKKIRSDLLICVDHEGGRVQRFKTDGFTHLPPMRALGQLWLQDGKAGEGAGAMRASNAATACGYVLGAELRACGVDLSFAPVLDLDYSASTVIGDRALSADARIVSVLAKSVIQGMQAAGLAHCGKHFPGHGFVKADSHTAIPVDRRSLAVILASDAAPYGWLNSTLEAVMPAHVIFPKVDTRPAGFSARWLGDILRGKLGFGGVVFSDDLSMVGARMIDGEMLSYTQTTLAALQAGCDLALLCNQSLGDGSVLDNLIAGMTEAQVKGQWQPFEASEERRRSLLPKYASPDWDALMVQARYMQALSLLP